MDNHSQSNQEKQILILSEISGIKHITELIAFRKLTFHMMNFRILMFTVGRLSYISAARRLQN